jgi:DNA mismatch endonuclease, patch repair protein
MFAHIESAPLVDIVRPIKRSQMMAGIKSKNTKPEIQVRKILHASGFRFRLHRKNLPGKPDIVLPKYKTALLVQGCFWHGHNDCQIFRLPKSRTEFWEKKIGSNMLRDKRTEGQLIQQGWRVLYVWECALKGGARLSEQQFNIQIAEAIKSIAADVIEVRGEPCYPTL